MRIRWADRDTWADSARGALVCSWRGHRWHRKMYGALCLRCSLFRADRR